MDNFNSGMINIGHEGIMYVHRNSNSSYDKVFEFFDKLILDELYLIQCRTWIAGGALREYFLNKTVTTDIDLYFSNETEFEKAKSWFLDKNYCPIDTILSRIKYDQTLKENYRTNLIRHVVNRKVGKVIADNPVTLKIEYGNLKLDLVRKYRPNVEMAIQSFDFTVASAALDYETLYFHPTYFIDLVNRDLIIKSFHHPLSTLYRIQKYIKMGFTISKENLFQLAKEIKSTPMAEINPVEFMLDQLENPNGVTVVDRPIRQKKEMAGTNGVSQRIINHSFDDFDDLFDEGRPQIAAQAAAPRAAEPDADFGIPEEESEEPRGGGIMAAIYGFVTKKVEEPNPGY